MKDNRKISTEKVVQFDFINTTGTNQALNLFSYLEPPLPNDPAIAPSNTIQSIFGRGSTQTVLDSVGNRIFIPDSNFTGNVYYTDTSGNPLFPGVINIGPGTSPDYVVIDTIQNYLYVSLNGANSVQVYDISFVIPSLVTTIPIGHRPGFLVYCPTHQKVYCIDQFNPIEVIDTTTNTLLPSIANPISATRGAYVPTTDQLWILGTNPSPTTRQIDSATDTFNPGSQSYGGVATEMLYNSATNQVYVVGSNFYALNVSPIAITCTIILGFAIGSGIGINTNNGYVYCFDIPSDLVQVVDPGTCSIVSSFNSGYLTGTTVIAAFNPANDYFFIPGTFANDTAVFSVAPTAANATYFLGTADYNAFVKDLEDNPIRISEIRFFVQNQTQFDEPLNIKLIDANGLQKQHSRFPSLDISEFQFQNNLAIVPFEDLVFNGRVFFSDYVLQPNERVIFLIKYVQVNKDDLGQPGPPQFFEKRSIENAKEIISANTKQTKNKAIPILLMGSAGLIFLSLLTKK
jgi:hypothetical protein